MRWYSCAKLSYLMQCSDCDKILTVQKKIIVNTVEGTWHLRQIFAEDLFVDSNS